MDVVYDFAGFGVHLVKKPVNNQSNSIMIHHVGI